MAEETKTKWWMVAGMAFAGLIAVGGLVYNLFTKPVEPSTSSANNQKEQLVPKSPTPKTESPPPIDTSTKDPCENPSRGSFPNPICN